MYLPQFSLGIFLICMLEIFLLLYCVHSTQRNQMKSFSIPYSKYNSWYNFWHLTHSIELLQDLGPHYLLEQAHSHLSKIHIVLSLFSILLPFTLCLRKIRTPFHPHQYNKNLHTVAQVQFYMGKMLHIYSHTHFILSTANYSDLNVCF